MDITTVFGTVIGGSNPPGDISGGGGENQLGKKGGYGLVVEHILAKDETGVQFSLPAYQTKVL